MAAYTEFLTVPSRNLPLTDLPQHLHLISVLHRLHDPATLYPQYFELRPELNPYLGYYYAVHLLAYLFPIDVANRVFLTAYAIGFPLSLCVLLRSLGRQGWPALLSVPFAYGDSFAWGFISYCAALPLVFLSLGFFVRALEDAARRTRWTVLFALALLGVFVMQPLPLVFLAVALPFLLLTTRVPDRGTRGDLWRARAIPALGAIPALAVALAWAAGPASRAENVAWGVPHQMWGPLLSPQNLDFVPVGESMSAAPWLLANVLRDGTDRFGLYAVLGIVVVALALRAFRSPVKVPGKQKWYERGRGLGLFLLALACFLWLPLNIHGRIYYVSPRFVHLAAAMALLLVPRVSEGARSWFVRLALAAVLLTVLPLARGFRAFDREARALEDMSKLTAERPVIMGLMFDTGSGIVQHRAYLHSAATLAWRHGGIPNYSFALEPHAPVRYLSLPPLLLFRSGIRMNSRSPRMARRMTTS